MMERIKNMTDAVVVPAAVTLPAWAPALDIALRMGASAAALVYALLRIHAHLRRRQATAIEEDA